MQFWQTWKQFGKQCLFGSQKRSEEPFPTDPGSDSGSGSGSFPLHSLFIFYDFFDKYIEMSHSFCCITHCQSIHPFRGPRYRHRRSSTTSKVVCVQPTPTRTFLKSFNDLMLNLTTESKLLQMFETMMMMMIMISMAIIFMMWKCSENQRYWYICMILKIFIIAVNMINILFTLVLWY